MLPLIMLLTACLWQGEDVSVSVADEPWGWDTAEGGCDSAVQAADTQLLELQWHRGDERQVWTPEVEPLGLAQAYTKDDLELLVVPSSDPAVESAWNQGGVPDTCPMSAWEGSCDVAHCDEGVDQSCAWLLLVPCSLGYDEGYVQEVVSHVAEDLERDEG